MGRENDIRLFTLANSLAEHALDSVEQNHELDLGRKEKEEPKEQDYYALMAAYFEKTGQIEQAGKIYSALVKANPNNGSFWLGLAVALEQTKKSNLAIQAYQRVLDNYESKPIIQAYAAERLTKLQG